VGLTCANAAIDEPCVANEPSYPALFDCMWSGEAGGPMARTGPVVANITEHTSPSGVLLGVQPYVRCPLPSYEELARISGYAGNVDATAVSVNVTLSHYGPVHIPFRGIPGGNLVTVRGLPTPPISPPSAPPPPAPLSPAVGLRALGYYSNSQTQSVIDGTDSANPITSRLITFTKKEDSSRLRLIYTDNLRVLTQGDRCVWELMVRDTSGTQVACVNTDGRNKIAQYIHNGDTSNEHRPHSIAGYCDGIDAGDYQLTVSVSTPDSADCYTGWSARLAEDASDTPSRYYLEAQEIPANSPALHVAYGGNSQLDDDAGTLGGGRELSFTKELDDTPLRMFYHDNFRSAGANAACEWEIMIDGASCPSHKLQGQLYKEVADNDHAPDTIVGMCTGVSAGDHTVTIRVGTPDGYTNGECYTGWSNTDAAIEVFTLEVDERPLTDRYFNWVNGNSKHDNQNGLIPDRVLNFDKIESDSRLRIAYYDNLRMLTANKACSWDVVLCIDGANCGSCSSGRISGDIYNSVAQNDHGFHVIEGYCDNVPAGSHTLKIDGGSTTTHVGGYSGGGCYTGWDTAGGGNHFHMEVLEIPSSLLS